MNTKQRHIIYQSNFDGSIFKYQVKRWAIPIFRILGLNTNLEIPINVVLTYEDNSILIIFRTLKLVIHRYRFGQSDPNPVELPSLLFLARHSDYVNHLKEVMDSNIQLTKMGANIGLTDMDNTKLEGFDESEMKEMNREVHRLQGGHFLIQKMSGGRPITNGKSYTI